MKKKLSTVLKSLSQLELAKLLGVSQPMISKLAQREGAVVCYDDEGDPTQIEYNKVIVLKKKEKPDE